MVEIDCCKCPVVEICAVRQHPASNDCPLLSNLIANHHLCEPLQDSSKSYKKIWLEVKDG